VSISTETEDLQSISSRKEMLPAISSTSPALRVKEMETLRSLQISSTLGKEMLPAKEKEHLRKRRIIHLLAILLPCIGTFYILSFLLSFLMGRSS
jgi:hypothetical protein